MHKLDPSLKRVLLFDSDQLILKHFDNLFSHIPPVDLAAPRAYWLRAEQAVFSSAFMLIHLSDRLWDKVNRTFPTGDDDDGGMDPKLDMDIMNDGLGDTATILSGEYVTLNSHWEEWGLPNWYHPEDIHNYSHARSQSTVEKAQATRPRRPTAPGAGLAGGNKASVVAAKLDSAHSEESDIYKQLFDLYEYTPIIHFTALGKKSSSCLRDAIRSLEECC